MQFPYKKCKSRTRSTSFQVMAFSFILSLLSIMLVMALLYFNYAKDQINKQAESLYLRDFDQYDRQLSTLFSQIETSFVTLGTGFTSIENDLLLYDGTPKGTVSAFEAACTTLKNYFQITFQNTQISYGIYFFPDESFRLNDELVALKNYSYSYTSNAWLYNNANVRQNAWYQNACASPNTLQWHIPNDQPDLICISSALGFSRVRSSKIQNIDLGVLLLMIPTSSLDRELALTEYQQLFLLDPDGTILYSSCELTDDLRDLTSGFSEGTYSDDSSRLTINGTTCYARSRQISSGLHLIFLESNHQYEALLIQFYRLFIGSVLLCLLVGVALSLYFSRKLSIPLELLSQEMESATLIQMPLPSTNYQASEVRIIYDSYNRMVDSILNLMERNASISRQKELLELNTLQAQLNPHFLCNSLNSLYCLAVKHKEPLIADTISALTGFLQYGISSPSLDVKLSSELEMLENYVLVHANLQKELSIRYSTDQIEPPCLDMSLPKMLLQPLVENCLKYGRQQGQVEIRILASRQDDLLSIIVENTGSCDVDAINRLLSDIGDVPAAIDSVRGFGIRNVHQRIRMKFGDNYGLHYSLTSQGNTAAVIHLPVIL